MENMQVAKSGLIALISVISYVCGRFTDLFWLVLLLMLIDYLTGIFAAIYNSSLNSKIGLKGIIKKLMYIVTIVFGFILDMTIAKILSEVHINFDFASIGNISIGTILIVFYVGNESVSILENLSKMGSKTPKFLIKIVRVLEDVPNNIVDQIIKTEPKDSEDSSENEESESNIESIDENKDNE